MTCEAEECPQGRAPRERWCYTHIGRMRRYGRLELPTWQDRYWAKVDKNDPDGCWLWTGGTSSGYGTMGAGPDKYAHRIGYILANGPIPAGMCVCHRCDVPRCVNPAHLFLGDIPANQQDMFEKLRSTWGARSTLAKLTEDDVHEIRRLLRAGLPQTEIAKRFGVSQPSIGNINTGKTWRHLVTEV
jgi:hypothetical protein